MVNIQKIVIQDYNKHCDAFENKKKQVLKQYIDYHTFEKTYKERLDQLQQKIETLKDGCLCKICFEQYLNVACKPCGHTLCHKCYDNIMKKKKKECPFCKNNIQESFKVFL